MNSDDLTKYLNFGITKEKIIKIISIISKVRDRKQRNSIYILLAEQIYDKVSTGEFYNFQFIRNPIFGNNKINDKCLQQYFDILDCYLLILQRCNHPMVVEYCDGLIYWWHDEKHIPLSIEYDLIYLILVIFFKESHNYERYYNLS